MDRLVIFGDSRLGFTGVLLDSFLREAAGRDNPEIAAVFDTSRTGNSRSALRSAFSTCRRLAMGAFNPELRGRSRSMGFYQAAKRYGVDVMATPESDVNSEDFLAELHDNWRPTLALSVGCLQIFGQKLLDSFEMAVNFHDGYLPAYRGLGATAWSVYKREPSTGFSFHVMRRGIDTGPVLVQGGVTAEEGEPLRSIRHRKTMLAAGKTGDVLDLMVGRSEGCPQDGVGSYYSAADGRRIRTIADPSEIQSEELLHRLRCFEVLDVQTRDKILEVTKLREGTGGQDNSLRTADGKVFSIHRCLHLPIWLYRAYRTLRRKG